MSLINKVLKNIEKKHAREPKSPLQKAVFSGLSAPIKIKNKDFKNIFILLCIIVLLLCALIYSYWPLNSVEKYIPSFSQKKVQQLTQKVNPVKSFSKPLIHQPKSMPPVMHKKPVPLTQKQLAEIHYNKAITFLNQHKTHAAFMELDQSLKYFPEAKAARQLFATLLLLHYKNREASLILSEGLTLHPNYLPFIQLKSRLLMQTGDIKNAIFLLENHDPVLQQHPNYYVFLASLYRKDHQYTKAIALYHELTLMNPSVGIWWVGLGTCFEETNHVHAAQIAYAKALKCQNLSPQIRAYITEKLSRNTLSMSQIGNV